MTRIIGIEWGLPNEKHYQSYHPDEPVVYAYSQQIVPSQLDFSPGFYNYGTLYLSTLKIASDVVSTYRPLEGKTALDDAMRARQVHLAGRVISAVAGAGTAWLVFLILVGRTALLGAAAGGMLLAIAPGHVIHSRFQTVDVLAAFLMVASLTLCSKVVPNRFENGETKHAASLIIWSAVLCGLSAGTKYIGILGIFPIALSLFLVPLKGRIQLGLISLAAMAVAFFVATPGILTESAKFVADFKYELLHTGTGHGIIFAETSSGFAYHIANLIEGFGFLPLVFGAAGLIAATERKHRWIWPIMLMAILIYILIGRAEVKFFRYALPLIPLLCVGFGWIVGQAQLNPNKRWRYCVAACIIAFGMTLRDTIVQTVWMVGPDPRDEAAAYVKKMSTVGVVTDPWFYTPSMYPWTALPRWVPFEERDQLMKASTAPNVVRYVSNQNERKDWDVRLLDELKPEAIAISSFETEGLERLASTKSVNEEFKGQVENYRQFIESMSKEYEPVALFGADGPVIHDLMYVRPKIAIWKRKVR